MARKPGRDDDDPTKQDKPAATASADEAKAKPSDTAPSRRASSRDGSTQELPAIAPPPPKGDPWPDATPVPMKPVEPGPEVKAAAPPHRSRTQTIAMGLEAEVGQPPAMPTTPPAPPSPTLPPPIGAGPVENPTFMPGPRDVPGGNPDDPAPAPGRVPAGDSRSLRRDNEFALIYRVGASVISRFGVVGKRGQWRVVEYPTSAAASHGYAKECSRFVSEGFSDYRD